MFAKEFDRRGVKSAPHEAEWKWKFTTRWLVFFQ